MPPELRRARAHGLRVRLQRHPVASSDNRRAEVPRKAELLEDELHREVRLVRVDAELPPPVLQLVERAADVRIRRDRLAAVLRVVARSA